MPELVVRSSATEEWLSLVHEAEAAAACPLDEEMQSYLVFLLMRFTEKPELAASVLTVEYLHSMQAKGRIGHEQLRDVGDKCLLYSGLFPRRAERRRVKISYFVNLGRSAYQHLSEQMGHSAATLYHRLADTFVSLTDILQTMRALGARTDQLDALQAFELWRDTGSRHALHILHKTSRATPLVLPSAGDKPRH